ncbi:MAG TPA: hypothetical protein VNQ90_01460 [Chthoniobacteraceae bacterium]|nr:hypothetical protein [Chthoniobacteraceae bacterium]
MRNAPGIAFAMGLFWSLSLALASEKTDADSHRASKTDAGNRNRRDIINITFDESPYTGPAIFVRPMETVLPLGDPTERLSHVPEGACVTVERDFVSGGSTTDVPFGNGHSLVLSKDEPGERGLSVAFHVAPGDRVAAGQLTVEFDFMVDDRFEPTPKGNLFITTRDNTSKAVSSLMVKPAGEAGGELLLYGRQVSDGSQTMATGEHSVVATLFPGRSYRITQLFDFAMGTVHVSIDGEATEAVQPFAVSEAGITGFDISTVGVCVGRWAIDNITASVADASAP